MVEGFEGEFAAFCGTNYCVGVGSGTDALRFALIAAGVREEDIVVTVPNTFIATTEAITQAGARPAFVDIDERTYNMDLGSKSTGKKCRLDNQPGGWFTAKAESCNRDRAGAPLRPAGRHGPDPRVR
jgi:hypothetical protein